MNIVRWLTNHPILSVWALTIVALLLSVGGTGGKKHDTDTNVASNEQIANTEASAQKVADNHADHGQAGMTEQASSGNNVQAAVSATPASTNAVVTGAAVASTDNSAPQEKAPAEEQAAATQAVADDLGDKSTDDLLLMAREAYWNNGLDEAASIYQQLIEREPNVIEHKGELGNVYWRQGFPEKSANLYAEIAIPMIEKGNADRVSNMIGFIGLFRPDKAAEINKRIQGAKR